MISKRLKYIIFIALVLIYTHGLEEIFTGFYLNDSTMKFLGDYFNITGESFYWISHAIWWIVLPLLAYVVVVKGKMLWLLVLFGLVFFIELHHFAKAIFARSYYPGMLTAILYPIIGIIYWRELFKNYKL